MNLTSEQREIRDLAREFAAGEIAPHAAAWDADGALPDDLFAKLGELGFLGMLVPAEHGGLELDLITYLLVLEELARADAAVALAVGIHNGPVAGLLLAHGSDEQKATLLPRLASGESLGAFALSEPGAGSDPGSMESHAEAVDGGWVLRGRKAWVTNGARAGTVLVFARTGTDGVGCFVVEPGADGYELTGRTTTMGLRASETVSVALKDLHLSATALIGEASRGLGYALEAIGLGRVGIAAQALGVGECALAHAARYAVEREQFGEPIGRYGAIQAKLANVAARLAAARALTMDVGGRLQAVRSGRADAGRGADHLAAQVAAAKLVATETAMYAADQAVQIFGGYGYMRDYPVEKLMRDAKGAEIYEGTSEIMRVVIAREILRDAGLT
jgi:alkylation response protein AidB-like acyl-CoA dehydrogenase